MVKNQIPKQEKIFSIEFVNIIFADLCLKICNGMQVTLLPLYVLELGFSTSIAGLMITFYMLTATLFRPASGRLVDKKGTYITMLIGSIAYCFATGFYLFDISIWIIFIMRAIQGFGFSFNSTALMTMATNIIPEKRMSEGIGYMGLTAIITKSFSPVFAIVLKNIFGFQITFLIVFIFSIIMLLFRFIIKTDKKENKAINVEEKSNLYVYDEAPLPTKNSTVDFLLSKVVNGDALKPALFMLFVAFTTSGINAFLVPYAAERGIDNPGMYFTVSAIMILISRLYIGKISQRFGTSTVLITGITLISINFIWLFACNGLTNLIVAGACYGLGLGVVQPQLNTLAVLSASKQNRGLANSTFFMSIDLGQAIGAVSLGAIADFAGMGSIFGFGAIVTFLTGLAYFFLRNKITPKYI